MSNRIFKSFAVVSIVTVMIFGATACASSAPTSPQEPATISNETSTGYTEEYVEQADGSVVRCLFWQKDYSTATMSCDFANAVPAPAE